MTFNLRGVPLGLVRLKRKAVASALKQPEKGDDHGTAVNPPKMNPSVFLTTVRVLPFPSHNRWNAAASKPSRLPLHKRENDLLPRPVRARKEGSWVDDIMAEFN